MVIPHQEKSTISPQPLGRFSRAPIPLERPSKTTHSEHKRSPRQRGSIAFYGNFTKERAITPEPLRAWSWDYASWKALANPVKMSSRPHRTDDFQVAAHCRCWTSADLNARFCFYHCLAVLYQPFSNGPSLATDRCSSLLEIRYSVLWGRPNSEFLAGR